MLKRFYILLLKCFKVKCTHRYERACEAIKRTENKIQEIDVEPMIYQYESKIMNF